ncbi:MAG: calcium-binding protein, partial [Rhodobacterales bacterium]|nr:calcium-binding protein [Rhodobacterales bacterium]
ALEGSGFGDTLLGDSTGNRLSGLGGNDRLDGRSGNDTLSGGDGNDTLVGGAGNDTFIFTAGHDQISDFTNGQDRIILDAGLWAGDPPLVQDLLASATIGTTGVTLILGDGTTLDIRGIFDTSLLVDDIQFL